MVVNRGFDAFVGNPPFLGGKRVSTNLGENYRDWLMTLHEAGGSVDLVAHFFRRGFSLLRQSGTLGLLATNTIAQGETRADGLRWICNHGGSIFAARRRYQWPGAAAVVVSIVHISKGAIFADRMLDGKAVPLITAFLFHRGSNEDPLPLRSNNGGSFIGSFVNGVGFTFDDGNEDATSLTEMRRLLAEDPHNQERIFPFIGGEDLNDSPTQSSDRYVIDFGSLTEEEARRWPGLMAIVETKVRPARAGVKTRRSPRKVVAVWRQTN
jgi:hypothetical protein